MRGGVVLKIVYRESIIEAKINKKNEKSARKYFSEARTIIEDYIMKNKEFETSLIPLKDDSSANELIRRMLKAGEAAQVGPFASVAGAIAQYMLEKLMAEGCKEAIIENGGDIALSTIKGKNVLIYAGKGPLSNKIIIKAKGTLGICTSSSTVGHSISFGNMDAACAISEDAIIADACATRLGNSKTMKEGISTAKKLPIFGAVLIMKDKLSIIPVNKLKMPKIGAV